MSAARPPDGPRLRLSRTIALAALAAAIPASCAFDPSSSAEGARAEVDAAEPPSPADATVAPPPDAAIEDESGTVRAARAAAPPTLDGAVDDVWLTTPTIHFDIADAELMIHADSAYLPSASADLRILHDDEALYFLIEATDDRLMAGSNNITNDDGLSFYLDGLGDRSGPYMEDDHAVIVNARGRYVNVTASSVALLGSVDTGTGGYIAEYRIEKSAIGGSGTASEMGFNWALFDNDGFGDDDTLDALGLWFLPDGPRCADCCASAPLPWCDTTMLGRLILEP